MNVVNLSLLDMESDLINNLVPGFFSSITKTIVSNETVYNFYSGDDIIFRIGLRDEPNNFKAVNPAIKVNGEFKYIGLYFVSDINDNKLFIFNNSIMFLFSAVNANYNFPLIINKENDNYKFISPCFYNSQNNDYKFSVPSSSSNVSTPITIFTNNNISTLYVSCNNVDKNTGITVLHELTYLGDIIKGVYIPFCRQYSTYGDSFNLVLLNNKRYFYTNFIVIED